MKNPCPGLWLADIQEQTKHLTSLTNNLITLSRLEEERTRLQMIDFPFSDVVEETVPVSYTHLTLPTKLEV